MINERMITLACNAMLVAGTEMGKQGDHWPVIKASIQRLKDDWEDLKTKRAVHSELKIHLADIVKEYELLASKCPKAVQEKINPLIREMREVYEAGFVDAVGADPEPMDTGASFVPWKTSDHLIRSLLEEGK